MMVKICGITNRGDALAAVDGGASALGFNFYPPSPRYIAPEAAHAILAALPPGVLKVGVFANEPAAAVAALAGRLGLDIVQLHGESPDIPAGLRVWRALPVAPGFDVASLDPLPAEAFLLDAPSGALYGGTGRSFDWSLARGARRPVILAGGLDETSVRRAIEEGRPWGVDACSRLESSPGCKDRGRMAQFLKAAQR
ncbi:MAG: phosphoribosylanthranilate isomerase [Bryobacteraceae bacterium]|jgi:phosphoribosylanthranilate isomerase